MYNEYSKDILPLRVADLDVEDKPREKAMKYGLSTLSKAELMAIILGSGMVGKSVIALSREILRDNDNSLYKVSRMSIDELANRYDGIGPAKAIGLLAAFELGTRCVEDSHITPQQVTSGNDVYSMMRQKLERCNVEEFWVIHLSRANRVIACECISRGGTAATVVDVKLILKSAINKLSSAIILVHNHPSGNLLPSAQDDQLTQRIKNGASSVDVRVIDHVIISCSGYYSYNDNGHIL